MYHRSMPACFVFLLLLTAVFAFPIATITSCTDSSIDSLAEIESDGKIVMITSNNANTYYYYRGRPMGFEYDLGEKFAKYLGVELEVVTPGWDHIFETLKEGEGHFIAAALTATEPRAEIVDFSNDYLTVQQQVVIHRDNRSIQEMEDLDGAEVHVRRGTSYQQRLNELQQQGIRLQIVPRPNVPTEELIRQVVEKEIDVTVADSNIALLNRRYYPDMHIAFPIEEPQPICWAVRKDDRRLLKKINAFLAHIKENGTLGKIYERYYSNVHIFDYVDLKKFHQRLESRLPRYESAIRRESEKHGFDWRLIAAVVYQESHFDPKARSHTGVRGLMQVTRATAKEMGISDRRDPQQSIRAGVGYLAKLSERFESIEDPRDRLLFALASYNVGYGHVRDAQQIAEAKGWNPRRWSSLKKALPLLRIREYYKDTKYGYARGTEPIRYIERILTYYDIIRQKSRS